MGLVDWSVFVTVTAFVLRQLYIFRGKMATMEATVANIQRTCDDRHADLAPVLGRIDAHMVAQSEKHEEIAGNIGQIMGKLKITERAASGHNN